jgi:hypothetical protein
MLPSILPPRGNQIYFYVSFGGIGAVALKTN